MNKNIIYIVGIGPGSIEQLTCEARQILQGADMLIGASRMLEIAKNLSKSQKVKTFAAYLPNEIDEILKQHKENKQICILMSGDIGFYSGAKKLVEKLKDYDVRLIPGISSISYMSAKIKVPWSEMKILSHHGRQANLIHAIEHHRWVFAILSGSEDLYCLGKKLQAYAMWDVNLYIGENLSYEDEKIYRMKPKDFREAEAHSFSSLLVVVIENPHPKEMDYFEIADEAFIRGKVPMTKSEVRTVSISKMHLTNDAIFYDIGAGTGSISIQVGKMYPNSKVYAIEKNPEAIKLMEENRLKFAVDNMTIIDGFAPKVLLDLPTPTHVFIGGSSGQLEEILEVLESKNPMVRVVISAIALETQIKVMQICKENKWQLKEMIQLSVAKAKEVGTYHLLMGQNPISIFVLERKD